MIAWRVPWAAPGAARDDLQRRRHVGRRRSSAYVAPRRSPEVAGFVSLELIVGYAFLLLPVALLATTLPTWAERQSIARDVAREAARTYVLTQDASVATARADALATSAGLEHGAISLVLEGDPRRRGSSVRATATVREPLLAVPLLPIHLSPFELHESHDEAVDLYRSVTP